MIILALCGIQPHESAVPEFLSALWLRSCSVSKNLCPLRNYVDQSGCSFHETDLRHFIGMETTPVRVFVLRKDTFGDIPDWFNWLQIVINLSVFAESENIVMGPSGVSRIIGEIKPRRGDLISLRHREFQATYAGLPPFQRRHDNDPGSAPSRWHFWSCSHVHVPINACNWWLTLYVYARENKILFISILPCFVVSQDRSHVLHFLEIVIPFFVIPVGNPVFGDQKLRKAVVL